MVNQQVEVGVATATPAIQHSPPMCMNNYIIFYEQRRSHGGILGILGSPGSLTGPERSMKLLAEERRVSGNGN